MEGPEIAENQALGAEVRRVLAERGLSDRGAAIKTGLARNTIDALKRGVNVNRTTIYKWAKSINEPVNKWLALAGYSHIADTSESPLPAAGFSYCPSPPPEVSEAIQAALAAKNVDEAVPETMRSMSSLKKRQVFLNIHLTYRRKQGMLIIAYRRKDIRYAEKEQINDKRYSNAKS